MTVHFLVHKLLHFILFFLILSYPIQIPSSLLFSSLLFSSLLLYCILFLFYIANAHHTDDSKKGAINQIISNTVFTEWIAMACKLGSAHLLPSPPSLHSRPSGIWSQGEEATVAGSLLFKVLTRPNIFQASATELLYRNTSLTPNTPLADFERSVCLFG